MNRRLITLFLIILVNFFAATIVVPTLPLYAHRHFGVPVEIVPLLNTAYFLAQFLAAPVLGRLSDKYGRLPVLAVSQFGTMLSYLMMGWAGTYELLFLARVLDGITGGNVIVAQAYITDITPRQQRTRALGLVWMAFGLGYTFGPAVGGFVSLWGEHVPFYVGAALSGVMVLLTIFTLDESLSPEQRRERRDDVQMNPHELFSQSSVVLICLIGFSAQLCLSLFQSTFPLYTEHVLLTDLPPRMVTLGVGVMLGALGVGQFLTQLVIIKPLVARLGERRMVILGLTLRAFGLLSLVAFASPWLVGSVSLIAFAVGSGVMMPSLQSILTISVDERITGGALGVYNAFTSMGIIIGSAVSGTLYAAHPTSPYIIGGVLLALLIAPAVALYRRAPVASTAPAATTP